MALRPSPTVNWMAHQAQRIVDQRIEELDARAALVIIERSETRSRTEQREANAAAPLEELRERGRKNRERAHRTSTGTTEGDPGAPRSGSA